MGFWGHRVAPSRPLLRPHRPASAWPVLRRRCPPEPSHELVEALEACFERLTGWQSDFPLEDSPQPRQLRNGRRFELFLRTLRFSRRQPYAFIRRSVSYIALTGALAAVVYVTIGWLGD